MTAGVMFQPEESSSNVLGRKRWQDLHRASPARIPWTRKTGQKRGQKGSQGQPPQGPSAH